MTNQMSRRTAVRAGAWSLATAAGIGRLRTSAAAQTATPMATPGADAGSLTPQEARAIARDTFIYGFPMVENYKTMYAYSVAEGTPNYKAPFNVVSNVATVYTPADTTIVTPNSDTPYSFVTLDLRAEPVVMTVAPIREGRYFSWQTIDLYTYLAPFIGSRATTNGGGRFLFAGPSWSGESPEGVSMVLRLPTDLALSIGRTQLFGPDDIDNVRKVQAGYTVQPLSAYLGEPAPPPAPEVAWMPYDGAKAQGIGFFDYLGFLLQFAPALPEDEGIRAQLARLGTVPGQPFAAEALSPEVQDALQAGIDDANAAIAANIATLSNATTLFGSRDFLRGRNFDRATGARYGIYGNAKEEAIYVGFSTDVEGRGLDGSNAGYTMTFAAGELPPVNAFWSVTVYDGKTQLLVANSIDRYLVNSSMLPDLTKDADGGLTIRLQYENPGPEQESNWLPVPNGPFYAILRMYWPQDPAINGTWQAPGMLPAS